MPPEYISYLVMAIVFVNGIAVGALTFGSYFHRQWRREIEATQRQREMARKGGVYRITNTAIGACYIGSTTRAFAARWGEHVADLEAGAHINKAMQRDWQIYGPDAFSFAAVEIARGEPFVRAREQEWIDAVRRELPQWLIYNRDGFRHAHRSSPAQTTIAALRFHLARDMRGASAGDEEAMSAVRAGSMRAAMQAEAAAYRAAHPIVGANGALAKDVPDVPARTPVKASR